MKYNFYWNGIKRNIWFKIVLITLGLTFSLFIKRLIISIFSFSIAIAKGVLLN